MPITERINLPFEGYNWVWAGMMPQESLKRPSNFLSVLRVLLRYDGLPHSTEPHQSALIEDLGAIPVSANNARPMEIRRADGSNALIRNNQVYWTNTGSLLPTSLTRGLVSVSPLAKALTLGRVSLREFALLMCDRMQMPNIAILDTEAKYQTWVDNAVNIKPLAIILKVLVVLHKKFGFSQAYITKEELGCIIIPSAPSYSPEDIADAIQAVRTGGLAPEFFPSHCLKPELKDLRVAKEFLQFLAITGILLVTKRLVWHIDKDGANEWCGRNEGKADCYTLNTLTTKDGYNELTDSEDILSELERRADESLRNPLVSRNVDEGYNDFRMRFCMSLGHYDHPLRSVSHITDQAVSFFTDILRQKKQVILYGPPGTGKTRMAIEVRNNILGAEWQERSQIVQFHQSYSYEDFIEGIRPQVSGGTGTMSFIHSQGIFKKLCLDAMNDGEKEYIIIIDEINRGNISSIFGELIMLLEDSYRDPDYAIALPYTREPFYIPKNVYLIGTMNSTDKSAIDIDMALRRRFAFLRLNPDLEVLERELQAVGAREIFSEDGSFSMMPCKVLEGLNKVIESDRSLGSDFMVGHSFFLPQNGSLTLKAFHEVFNGEILPLLEEYLQVSPRLTNTLQSLGINIQGTTIKPLDPAAFQEVLTALSNQAA